jgi:hypothetical protein
MATRTDAGRTERVLAAERRIAAVAYLLDNAFAVPGTDKRVGIDPVIGLVPFLGDLVSGLMSAWIVIEAARFKLPGIVLVQMMLYVGVDFVVGLIPFLGDLFDMGFKANTRILGLFHAHAVDPGTSTASAWALVGGVALAFGGMIWLGIVLLGRLFGLLFS